MDAVVLKKKGYSLGDTLGEGSYGKVKAAYSHRLKFKVAIKIIDKKKISQNVLEKFLPREMEALMRLHHPSIIETYEIFETSSGKVYIVMELGERGSLLSYLTSQAPELLEHIPCDPRISDMWSLGIILYAMLFASQPFDSSNIKEMLQVQKQQKIHFMKSKNLSTDCKNLIVHLLHPDASQRLCIDEVLRHPWLQTPKLVRSLRSAGGGDPKASGKKSPRNNRMTNPIVRKCKEWRRKSDSLKDTFL
ncbi:hypothetical protein DV515_00007044 [Chloebia gouldiae]|uniref:non-specific serine/threonine protein kinase n=1 Tax=Chloebia gouldiae TaxID=44316 RepID=A0A3L8SIN3_CHLGU|nr:hypothetical protein DV515_00007044 [Chloebia gouldiae]